MSGPSHRRINWGRSARRTPIASVALRAEPPAYLGTWQWRQPGHLEPLEEWRDRVARQRQAILNSAANWLKPGQRVRVQVDPRAGGGNLAGRVGAINRLCSPVFADYAYVQFEPRGREKVPRVRMNALESLDPVE